MDDVKSDQAEEGRYDRFKYITIDMTHFGNYGNEEPLLIQTRTQLSFNGKFINSIDVKIDKSYDNDNGAHDHRMKVTLKSPTICGFNVPIPTVEPMDIAEHYETFNHTFSEATPTTFAWEDDKSSLISERLQVIINPDEGDLIAHTKMDFYYDGDYPRRDPKVSIISLF